VHVRHAAVSGADGPVTFFLAPDTMGSSMSTGGPESVTVDGLSLDTLIGDLPVDLLKVDIEGAEWDVLRSYSRLDSVATIVGEWHADAAPVAEKEFFSLFGGFELVELEHGPAGRAGFVLSRRGPAVPAGAGST
jgi:hypothetical protein